MHWRSIALGGWGLILLSCVPAMARPSHDGHGGNCVAYAREVTGIHLDGNAATWWPHAEGRYDRGQRPSVGAILVFKPYARMHVGHVAVVSRIVGPREVLVDQANWVRGRVTTAMSVVDASAANDWTLVKVLEPHSGTHGRENPTYGFIYPRVTPASFGETIVEPPRDRPRAEHAAAHSKHRKADAEAVAETIVEPQHDRPRAERAAAHSKHRKADAEAVAETIVEPRPDRPLAERAAAHSKHRKVDAETAAETAEGGKPHRVATNDPPRRKHKPVDAELAYVY